MTNKKKKFDIYQEAPSNEKYFYLNNKIPLKNLAELIEQLTKIDQETFKCHVNKKNNDFAKWVRDVFGEKELARRMKMSRSPQGMLKSITKFLEG
ncbi:MAG: hypothetical protein PHD33_01105 [Atribacterota bacterium]|nr:hypothetical protein [Atribacterota bacterium]